MTDDPDKYINMDKKGSFPPLFAANTNKALTLDSSLKASSFSRQDGTPGSQMSKVQTRTPSRYRGSQSGNANNSRSEPNLRYKSSPQRGKGYVDRRQKPRNGAVTTESVAQNTEEPEAGSLQSPGGKKQNINNLWGFHFAPRESQVLGSSHGLRRSHPPGGGNWRFNCVNGIRPKYSKDFLLANCQFLVSVGEDYTVYLADPDLLVRWELIEEVRIRVDGEMPKCPICLDFPAAAKITKCGHIYCWSCFLHYLALSDNKIRTCPICYEHVSKDDLKSVSLVHQTGIEVGSKIEMQLMVRPHDSTVAYPLEKYKGWERKFCKILQVAPMKLIQSVLVKEHRELDDLFNSDPHAPEVCFIQQALEELSGREIALVDKQTEFCAALDMSWDGLIPPDVIIATPETGSGTLLDQQPEIPLERKPGKEDLTRKTRNDSVSSTSSGGFDESIAKQYDAQGNCYFYQMVDGRNVFLHPLNMAMLWRELGSDPDKWPQTLRFQIIDIESKSATEEARKRLKFIRHLPKNVPFELIEVSMDGWGISPEIYADFASQLRQRDQRRKQRVKEEKIMERKQRERESQEFNKFRYHPQISSTQEFPMFGSGLAGDELTFAAIQEELDVVAFAAGVPEFQPREPVLAETLQVPTSFAQIAGKAPMKKSPTFPISSGSVWGKTISTALNAAPILSRHSDSENDCEDYVPVPNYRSSVSEAIERALAGLDLSSQHQNTPVSTERPAGGNKKKKNKKGKVLFATGMGHLN